MNYSLRVFLILIFSSFISCTPKYWDIEKECVEGSNSMDNSEFTINLLQARNGIINTTKTFKSKDASTEEETEIRKDYESLRYQINNMLDELKTKLSQKEQRNLILKDASYLDNTIGIKLDAARNQYDNHYRHKINKMLQSEYAALGLSEVAILITVGNELYKVIAGYLESGNSAKMEHYRTCFETNYIDGKKLPEWEQL